MNDYAVRYGEGHRGSGRYDEITILVTAYTAMDAGYQAMLAPEKDARINAPHAFCSLVAVAPFQEGMKFNHDFRGLKSPYFQR